MRSWVICAPQKSDGLRCGPGDGACLRGGPGGWIARWSFGQRAALSRRRAGCTRRSGQAGQELAVLEAMKMENVLRAERDAVVEHIRVEPGATVAAVNKILNHLRVIRCPTDLSLQSLHPPPAPVMQSSRTYSHVTKPTRGRMLGHSQGRPGGPGCQRAYLLPVGCIAAKTHVAGLRGGVREPMSGVSLALVEPSPSTTTARINITSHVDIARIWYRFWSWMGCLRQPPNQYTREDGRRDTREPFAHCLIPLETDLF